MAAPRKRKSVEESATVVEESAPVVEESAPVVEEAVRVTPESPLPKQQSVHTMQAPPADVVTPNSPPAKAQ